MDPRNAAAQEQADGLRADFQRMLTEGPEAAARARRITVTRRSRDGLVSVTVGPRGDLVTLDIDPRVFRRPDSRAPMASSTRPRPCLTRSVRAPG